MYDEHDWLNTLKCPHCKSLVELDEGDDENDTAIVCPKCGIISPNDFEDPPSTETTDLTTYPTHFVDSPAPQKMQGDMEKQYIQINTAIAFATITTILPVLGIYEIPNLWWGILIKIFLLIFIIATLQHYFTDKMWSKAIGFGAGITLNMLWFSCMWFLSDHWSVYV